MRQLLFLAFLVVPLIEIGLFILLGNAIGLWPTLLGVLVTAIVGAVLLRTQGRALLSEIVTTMGRGQLPARALADAMMIGVAAVLLMTPGYFTDLMGIMLLIPAVRTMIYHQLARRFAIVPARSSGAAGPQTIDLDDSDWRQR